MNRTRVLIAGAAGRDFHNFNLVYRGREEFQVVGFTATQIPNIDGRVYPPELAGELYPEGIPIWPEADLERAIARHAVDEVVFAYSDVTHEHVMHLASRLRESGKRVAVLRHPMPYGDLAAQAVQRFERYEDLDAADATIEEREEYEPH